MVSKSSWQTYLYALTKRRILTVFLLGFSSGLPFALIAGTLQAWFTTAGLDLKTIGAASLIGLPYTLKPFIAPIIDRYRLPLLGRRRGWLLLFQFALLIAILFMSTLKPTHSVLVLGQTVPLLMIIGVCVAFFSTCQDIVINAYQTEVLYENERGLGASLGVTGWRISFILSGSIALILASHLGWHLTYIVMSLCMLIGVFATLFGPNPDNEGQPPMTFVKAIYEPFVDFFSRQKLPTALLVILLILTYKIGDALALALNTTFLIKGVGFSLDAIGVINKNIGIIGSIAGGIIGGLLMLRLSLFRSLMLFGLVQAIANLGYMWLAIVGKNYSVFVITAFSEHFFSGMGTAAFVALLMSQCNLNYTATQYALFTSLSLFGRTWLGPIAASMVDHFGWAQFFFWSFIVSLPCLFFVWLLRHKLEKDHQDRINKQGQEVACP
ncbi:AmpG family muropeptide MFS transporter [Piscirickettsia salmonis]|uniref:AmpG family muropeptide MFS transporter n=1 Tax=Piscirickettsia salmonis TaxID=1238 RepID=UPI000F08F977|nr:MFS transporter [Piscirickettsiaceae bacterium NZ-RLO2]